MNFVSANRVQQLKVDFSPFCKKHRLLSLAVFGSMARGTATAESDLDLLVDPSPGTPVDALLEMAGEAEEIAGRRVDFVLLHSLSMDPNPEKTKRILSDAVYLYGS
jgi:uncharacterized protein